MRIHLGCIVTIGLLYAAQLQAIESPRPFIIVAEPIAPYEYPNATGAPSGINVEIIDHVFQQLGIPYEIRFYP